MSVSTIIDESTRSVSTYPQARPVINGLKERLEQRDQQVAEALINGGVALGARREQVEALLVQAGLVEPTPEPEPEPEPEPVAEQAEDAGFNVSKGRKSQRIAMLEQQVVGLTEFARRHGFTG